MIVYPPSASLDELGSEFTLLRDEWDIEELELQDLPGLVNEGALLHEKMKTLHIESLDSDVTLQVLEVLLTEHASIQDQAASLLSTACSAKERIEGDCAVLHQHIIDLDHFKNRKAV